MCQCNTPQTASWTVTLPGDLESGEYNIEVIAAYTSNGTAFEISSSIPFSVR